MKNFKVLVINDEGDDLSLEKKILEKPFGKENHKMEVIYIPQTDKEKVNAQLPTADGVISVYTEFDKKTIEKMEHCKIIATQTIGVNLIDLEAATKKGIYVTNVPDYCVEEVALHTVSLALSCVRKLKPYDEIARKKAWNIDEIYKLGEIHRISGQTYGLASFGNIPRKIASIMKCLGMKVIAFDPYVDDKTFAEYGVGRVKNLEELFSKSNLLSLHIPLTRETEDIIDLNLLKKFPKGGILINTSRGGIIKENDLYQALKNGYLDAFGTDVIKDETDFETPLYQLDNVMITPHMAYYSEEALEECRVKAVEQVRMALIEKKRPIYLVNKELIVD